MASTRPKRISFQQAVSSIVEMLDSDDTQDEVDSEDEVVHSDVADDLEHNDSQGGAPVQHLFEEYSDGELNVIDSDNETSSSDDETSNSAHRYTDHVSPNGFCWSEQRPTAHRLQRNVIDFIPGPTTTPETEIQSFNLFVSEIILRTILRYTNSRIRALGKKTFSLSEMKACIAVIVRAGADRDNLSSVESLFTPSDSRPFYRCAVSKNRLKLFLRHVTFDNKNTRIERQKTDKLAAIREMWNLFELNLAKNYVPSESLTIDEQLYPFRGYVPGRSYMPMKPAKYGTKLFWICDAKNGYALQSIPYCGKLNNEREVGLAENVVLKLSERYFNSGRNIFMDRFFSSHSVARKLLEKGLTMTGTIKQNRREVPPTFRCVKSRDTFSTKELWDGENRIMLLSYVPKRNKNVLMISSMHSHPGVNFNRDDMKPDVIDDYNHGKGGVDVLDSRIEDFTCKRMTRRYPLIFFFLMLDVALVNSYLVLKESKENYTADRKTFIKMVSESLASEFMVSRYNSPKIFSQLKNSFALITIHPIHHQRLPVADPHTRHGPAGDVSRSTGMQKVGKCQIAKCRKSTRHACAKCAVNICSEHKVTISLCGTCVDK